MNHVNFHSTKNGGQLNIYKDHVIDTNTIPDVVDRIMLLYLMYFSIIITNDFATWMTGLFAPDRYRATSGDGIINTSLPYHSKPG